MRALTKMNAILMKFLAENTHSGNSEKKPRKLTSFEELRRSVYENVSLSHLLGEYLSIKYLELFRCSTTTFGVVQNV